MSSKVTKFFTAHWPKLLFLLLAFALFHPFFLKGKVPIALDIPTGMYYPWLNESFGYQVKVPVKNSLLTDTISQFWIWRNWAVDGLKTGQIKTWNPMSLAGYEMSPWFHTIIFSPFNTFYFFMEKATAMSWIIISQVIVSLFSSYIFAKKYFKTNILSVYFALSWTLSSYFVGWLTWGTVSHALASLPLILYFVLESKKNWLSGKKLFLYFFSHCLYFLSGHLQTIAYGLFIWFAFVVVSSYKSSVSKYILKHLSLLALSLLVLSPVIFPSLKVILNSIRAEDSQLFSVNFGLVPISKVLALSLSPNFFGNPATGNYFGGGYNFQEKLVYFGTIPLFFSVFALVNFIRSKVKKSHVVIGLFFVTFGLIISTENSIGKLVYDLSIPIFSSSPAGRGLIVYIFGAVILSAAGLSDFMSGKKLKKNFFLTSLFVFFCYLFSFSIILTVFKVIDNSPPSLAESYTSIKSNYTTLLRNLALSFATFSLFWIIFFLSIYKKQLKILAIIAALTLTTGDSYLFFKKYTPFTPPSLYFPETDSLKFLSSKLSPTQFFRVERQSGEVMPPNMWEPYKLNSLSGYDPMSSKPYQTYLIKSKIIPNYSRYVELGENLNSLSNMGVKYLMVLRRDNEKNIDKDGDHPKFIDTSKWQEVATEGPVSIMENKFFTPPYTLKNAKGTVKLSDHTETSIHFEVTAEEDTELIFYQNQNSNWSAKVNEQTVKINAEEGTFFGVPVKSGNSTVKLLYRNRELSLGLQVSLLSFLVLLFVIFKIKV